MTSNYVIVSIKLCLDVRNDEYIILCNFGGRIMSESRVTGDGLRSPSPRYRRKKSPACMGLKG